MSFRTWTDDGQYNFRPNMILVKKKRGKCKKRKNKQKENKNAENPNS